MVGDVTIPTAEGGQQGDPLGPALFSLAIHQSAPEAHEEAELTTGRPLHFTAFFLDDGLAVGDAAIVRAWEQAVNSRLHELCLTLRTLRDAWSCHGAVLLTSWLGTWPPHGTCLQASQSALTEVQIARLCLRPRTVLRRVDRQALQQGAPHNGSAPWYAGFPERPLATPLLRQLLQVGIQRPHHATG